METAISFLKSLMDTENSDKVWHISQDEGLFAMECEHILTHPELEHDLLQPTPLLCGTRSPRKRLADEKCNQPAKKTKFHQTRKEAESKIDNKSPTPTTSAAAAAADTADLDKDVTKQCNLQDMDSYIQDNDFFPKSPVQHKTKYSCAIVDNGIVCNGTYTRLDGIRKHQRSQHLTKDYNFLPPLSTVICKTCDEEFHTPGDLQRHELSHRQIKKKCEHCFITFKKQSSLLSHMRKCHIMKCSDFEIMKRRFPFICILCRKKNHMNAMNMQMRSMNRLMTSLMPDPFNMLTPFDPGFHQNAIMERGPVGPPMGGLFGFPAMPNINRLLSADIGAPQGASYCSSSVISMSSGPDGRPQIYQATSSTKTGPGGIRETRKTVQDSSVGMKKMAIGHHIGERAHIIEKEQDLRSGQLEERQEFINLEEEEAEDFDREFTTKARRGIARAPQQMLTIEPADDEDDDERPRHHRQLMPPRRQLPALPAPPTQQNNSSTSSSSPKYTTSSSTTPTTMTSTASLRANASATNANNYSNNNNNNNYLSTTPRRAYRSHLATPRRPLRTPSSSPLATTPTNHSHITATSPSVHPHPYNAAAARRNHRSKHNKHHQQQQQQQQHQQQQQPSHTQASAAATTTTSHQDDNNI